MSAKGFGTHYDGHLWWDSKNQRTAAATGYTAARNAFQTKRYFLSGPRAQKPDPEAGPSALLREFSRYWQSRWVKAYTAQPDVASFAKGLIRKRQGSTFEAQNVAMIQRRLDERLVALPVATPFDPNLDFARPYSFLLAADLLGLVLDPDLCHRAAEVGAIHSAQDLAPESKAPAYRALQILHTALRDCTESGAIQADGLMHGFLEIEAEHALDRDFTLMSAANFLAGSVTLGSAMTLCLYQVEKSDELTSLVRARDPQIPKIVEEILRLHPPARTLGLMTRAADTAEPELVSVSVARANTDPNVFPHPDKMVLDRCGPQHLSFGSGAHTCDGVRLVRQSLEIALPEIFERLCGLELREVGPMQFTARFDRLMPSPNR